MAARKKHAAKKYFSVGEANAMLPLVRAIIQDITGLARELKERQERLERVQDPERGSMNEAYREELREVQAEVERDQERLGEYVRELKGLGVELKDFFIGLIDFPSQRDGREICLCWRLGEPEVGYWHELEAGFMGRQKIMVPAASK